MAREVIASVFRAGLEAVVALVQRLTGRISELEAEVQSLQQKIASLERDSTNSSKPPSSDGPKKKRGAPKRGASGRKPGGQKGHVGKARQPVPPAEVRETVPHRPTECTDCGRPLSEAAPSEVAERRQVWELPEIKPFVDEHVFYQVTCPCGATNRLPVPDWIMSGMGENLQAHLAYLTSEARLSRRTLQNVLAELLHVPWSLGGIQNRLEDTSAILKASCDELEDRLCQQSQVNIDETSYPHNAKLHWLWVFVASTFVYFAIRTSRGSKVLKEVLGETFDGIIVCDRFSAYVKYHKDRACGLIQYCWAHIIRDLKGLPAVVACGSNQLFSKLARQRIGAVFRLWHTFRRGHLTREELIEKAEPHVARLRTLLEENLHSSDKEVRKLCKGVLKKWDSFFTFLYHEGVEPTNNLAERHIRPAVQTRKLSYCTRSENGQLLRTRLLTVSGTCRMNGRNPYQFLRQTIHAHRHNLPTPSLLTLAASPAPA